MSSTAQSNETVGGQARPTVAQIVDIGGDLLSKSSMVNKKQVRAATLYAVEKVRARYGSYRAVAEAYGTTTHNVRMWKYRGWVTPKYVMRVARDAEIDPVELSPVIFGADLGNGSMTEARAG